MTRQAHDGLFIIYVFVSRLGFGASIARMSAASSSSPNEVHQAMMEGGGGGGGAFGQGASMTEREAALARQRPEDGFAADVLANLRGSPQGGLSGGSPACRLTTGGRISLRSWRARPLPLNNLGSPGLAVRL